MVEPIGVGATLCVAQNRGATQSVARTAMPYLRDRAIILRSDPYREHDRRIVLFGMQHGLLEAVARGASARQAKQGGHIVPLTEAEVLIAKGAAFDKLAVARIAHARPGVRRRLPGLAFAGAFADLFYRLQQPGIVDVELYRLLQDALSAAERLPHNASAERTRLLYSAAVLKLLDRIGFAPPLSACASCREGFSGEEGEVWLLPTDGTFVCPDCYRVVRRAHPSAESVSGATIGLLRRLRHERLDVVLDAPESDDAFRRASVVLSVLLRQAPLSRAPHGSDTILALLI